MTETMNEKATRGTMLDASEKKEIAILAAQGKTPHAISKLMNRSATTIKKYLKTPEVAAEKENIEERLASKFEQITERILDAVTETDIAKADLKSKMIAAGVAIDKGRLIRGQSTANMAVFMAAVVVEADQM